MPRFAFSLAALLRVREVARNERRLQLAEAHEALRLVDDRLADLGHEDDELAHLARHVSQPGQIDVNRLADATRYGLVLKAQRHALARQRAQVEAEVERRRTLLVEAERQVRALEKLREQQWAESQYAENRRETQALDEAALVRAARKEVET